jgi:hypothetical protein
VVYVGSPVSAQGVRGRELFRAAAVQLAEAGPAPRPEFFDIEDEGVEDAQAWAAGFRDDRLAGFGYLASGWVLWLEGGVLRAADPYAGGRDRTSPRELVERTRAVWP